MQNYPSGADLEHKPTGEAITKIEALQQCSGEATYTADVQMPANGVHGWVVPAMQMGKIRSIDASQALAAPGIVAFITSGSVRAVGASQTIQVSPLQDYPIFASSEVKFVGHMLGVVLARTQVQAKEAARLIKVTYEAQDRQTLRKGNAAYTKELERG